MQGVSRILLDIMDILDTSGYHWIYWILLDILDVLDTMNPEPTLHFLASHIALIEIHFPAFSRIHMLIPVNNISIHNQ